MADSKNRCMWGVTGIIPGKGWGGIQCDGTEGHRKRVRFTSGEEIAAEKPLSEVEFDHSNYTFGVFWNEDHENASSPDMPFVHPGNAVPTQDAPEFGTPDDPEPGPGKCFVIKVEHETTVIAVAMTKKARDEFLRVYNLNRHSDRAVAELTMLLVG